MPKVDVAIVGGTGVGPRLAQLGGKKVLFPTPYGNVRGLTLEHQGVNLLLVQRHASGHKIPPHKINYRATAHAMKKLGVKGVLSSAAVGCLRDEWPVGTFCIVTDFLDLSCRRMTMFDRTVEHRDFTHPLPLDRNLLAAANELGEPVQPHSTYLCNDGPRYETPAEIHMMRIMGADLVGMTASTEAIALRELEVPYGCLAVVTNSAAGMSGQELHHGEVTDVMENRGQAVVDILLRTAINVAKS